MNRIENETAQTQSKPVTPSIQHLALERPTDDEEEERIFTKACRQKLKKYAEVVMKVQKQIREACDKAVEDQNVEECDKAAEDQEVIEILDDDGRTSDSTLNEDIFGSPESGTEGDIETDADEDVDIILDTDKENINLDSEEELRKTDHHLKHIQKETECRCEENSKKEEEGDNIKELDEFKDLKRNPLRHVHDLLEQRCQEKSKQKAMTDHPSEDSDSYHKTSNSNPDWKRDSADLFSDDESEEGSEVEPPVRDTNKNQKRVPAKKRKRNKQDIIQPDAETKKKKKTIQTEKRNITQSDVDKKKQIQLKTKKIKMSGRDDENPLEDEEQDSSLSVTAKLHHEG